jgi:hypothetical protein
MREEIGLLSRREYSRRKGKLCRFCSTREVSNETRMVFLGAGEEEDRNGASSTLSGDAPSILEYAKFDSYDRQLLIVIGVIPIRESPAKLLG